MGFDLIRSFSDDDLAIIAGHNYGAAMPFILLYLQVHTSQAIPLNLFHFGLSTVLFAAQENRVHTHFSGYLEKKPRETVSP